MVTQILDEVLGDFADLGFRLEEEADEITVLYFKERFIDYFNQPKAQKEIILQACQKYLDRLNGKGVSFEE